VLENIEHGQRVYESLARLPCPTVAAVHGACMGGGTELILACRQRIAADDDKTKIGLPEVMLGIHPGWGGTARLPRLIGAPDALPMMLTGKRCPHVAQGLGVVDRLARPEELLAEARLCCVTRSRVRSRNAPRPGRPIRGWPGRFSRPWCSSRPRPRYARNITRRRSP
jgi:3-hydroxyacyl-CoA dehydrogenase/enoyl-CoA hydratase/3-hydroxybutyryl-CoA epimerase